MDSSITIEFLEFNSEEDKDEVQILNGSFQELAVYSGQYETGNLPEPYTVTGETMYLAFIRSATINKPGWTASYTINNVGIEHYNDILNNVNCSPNPAKNSLTIDLNLKESQEVILKFISLTGKEIFTDKFRSNVGLNQKTLSLNGIPKGIYLLRLESNKINHIEKIVVN